MLRILLCVLLVAGSGCDPRKSLEKSPARPKKTGARVVPKMDYSAQATALARKFIVVDGHIDVPYRLVHSKKNGKLTENVAERTEKGDFDYARALQGGLDAPFMSIYVPAEHQTTGGAKKAADALIDLVEGLIARNPKKFARARTVADVKKNFEQGVVSLPMGIENGAAIEDDTGNIKHFYERGARYITLTHSKDNQICDSSFDDKHTWRGLSPFGKKVIAEMNRVGVMIDVSHVSDDAFYQVMDLTKVPVIASHSSARHFTPGFERNMSDAMIQKMKDNGGVVMINFGSSFIKEESRRYFKARREASDAYAKKHKLERPSSKMDVWDAEYSAEHPPLFATVEDVADHIDHVVKLAGIDHVGLGSDFDGVRDSLPVGLKDVSAYPNLIAELLRRRYGETEIQKLCSGNVLRVWQAVEDYAAKQ